MYVEMNVSDLVHLSMLSQSRGVTVTEILVGLISELHIGAYFSSLAAIAIR